jgi:alkanesulfonate monooxygenase
MNPALHGADVGRVDMDADRGLAKSVDLGVGTLLIRGFDPLDDTTDYGRELIPRLRALVAEREGRGQKVHEESAQLQAA